MLQSGEECVDVSIRRSQENGPMAERTKNPAEYLSDALVTDLLGLSDAQLLSEVIEEGVDPDHEAGGARAVIAAALVRIAGAAAPASKIRAPGSPSIDLGALSAFKRH